MSDQVFAKPLPIRKRLVPLSVKVSSTKSLLLTLLSTNPFNTLP